ncbi:MAG: DdlA: D-alanine--D-alanine ligase [Candidatus Parcubacteria bacterium]|jgi:D-alanine-D-alanine ligase
MKRVAVLRGGPSSEYDVSLKTGAEVLSALRTLDYPHKDITITKKGEWLDSGFVRSPEKALEAVDVVFVALHGEYGEDGQVQRILQRLKLPFTGSNALSSAIAFNKELAKQSLKESGINMARHRRLHRDEVLDMYSLVDSIVEEMGQELFIKPIAGGSSIGAKYVPHRDALKPALEELFLNQEVLMIEEFIRGREATVGVLEGFRNESLYVLPAIEIVPPNGSPFFSYEVKYNGKTQEICPGRFSYHEKAKLTEAATKVHKILNCDHYSRTDFIVRDGEVYFLEVNTLPGLTSESLFPKAAAAVGLEFKELVRHLIETARV